MQVSPALQQAEALLPKLTEEETEILLHKIFNLRKQPQRGVSKTPGVCGGRACIEGTRMPVWSLVNHKLLGYSDLEILRGFPTMTAFDLKTAWNYYLDNREEIEADIKEQYSDDDDEN